MNKLLLLLLWFLGWNYCATAKLNISVLSHGPGLELYSTFGHSAIRVQDDSSRKDEVYNYGVFDFRDPDFLQKFVQGKTYYYVDVEKYEKYMAGYLREGRWTKEQRLEISQSEAKKLYLALAENAKEENKYYLYDIFRNNCSTKIWELIRENIAGIEMHGNLNTEGWSYKRRVLEIYKSLDLRWIGLGVNIVMGANSWHKPDNVEMNFLPHFLHENIDRAVLRGSFLSRVENKLSAETLQRPSRSRLLRPTSVFLMIGLLMLLLYMSDTGAWKTVLGLIALLFAVLGFLILGLWLFTTHPYLSMNTNLLWANPLFLFILWKPSAWRNKLLYISRIMLLFVIVFSVLDKNIFPVELFPVWIMLWIGLRGYYENTSKILDRLWKR